MAVQVRLSTADQRRILAELKRESRANARTLDKRLKRMEAPKGPKVEPEEGKEGGPSTAPEGDLGTEVNPIQVEDDGDDDFDGELYDSSGLERVMPIVTKYTLDDLLYVAQVVAREHSNSSVFGFTTDLSDTGTADQDVINTAVAETLKRLGIKPKREEQHVQDAGPPRGSQNMPPGMYQWSGPPKSDNDGFKLILERLDQQEAKWKDTLTGLRKEQKEQLTEFETRMEAKIDKRVDRPFSAIQLAQLVREETTLVNPTFRREGGTTRTRVPQAEGTSTFRVDQVNRATAKACGEMLTLVVESDEE
ncbi:hypothetical protein CC1G_12178 [Coprinopsis cinerea okayama7|uniref:Uncharacterized protein n=1 Tax=Coprinopsis cinerea (strain Okayama-7 / 130 / ATCC MYA-4618 / FGSC 9003) TaxID=240176 RepID=A8NHM9_COPC7|nr:hypothetical protein CC1G_12178 [Coprinopsis cinerea okayama7\|eukprot:XP_001833796.1 hypothetical protein CC1G_12178 [Coprinopsis cinerea okayama7\